MSQTDINIKISKITEHSNLLVNNAGDYIFMNNDNLDNFIKNKLSENEINWLEHAGIFIKEEGNFFSTSRDFKSSLRLHTRKKLNYLIIIPTLRCNLTCSYCQVSRADEKASGYDWDEDITRSFIKYVEKYASDDVKIEFQGGEPSLRLDLVLKIVNEIKSIKPNATFVICSNLSIMSSEFIELLDRDDFFVSSSLDGPPDIHESNRTQNTQNTDTFFNNLEFILLKYGTNKISLLPTISDYSRINETIDFFYDKKLPEIFLRPVNYQGFARKKFNDISQDAQNWNETYNNALEYIAHKNSANDHQMVETGLLIHLDRIFKQRSNNYVDLRNPNLLGQDYLVIDFDGKFYPSDEARMLSRIGLIDLSIGSLNNGIDERKINQLNTKSSNTEDPCCNECSYQPFCGVDIIDNISRYGTTDMKTLDTHFCNINMNVFDFIFKNLSNRNEYFINLATLCLTKQSSSPSIFGGHHFD